MTAKVVEELNQSNENSDTKKEGIKHIKVKLGESLKKIGETWYFMASILEVWVDSLLVQKTCSYGC